QVWHDLNQNGQQDPDESGLENWAIFLDENQNGLLDETERSTLTDANGQYTFTNLAAGTYTIAEVVQPGWQQVYPFVGAIEELFSADFSTDDGSPSLDGFTIDNTGAAVDGLWHLSTGRGAQPGHSPDDSLYFGQGEDSSGGGNYNVGHTAGRITSPTIDLSGIEDAIELSFNYVLETEGSAPEWDNAVVLVSVDGGSFEAIASNAVEFQESAAMWSHAIIDLSDYAGSTIQIQFDFDTGDGSFNTFEGWYIDDVEVYTVGQGTHEVTVGPDDVVTDINFGNTLINQPPVATDDTFSTAEDSILSDNVLTNDSDADADPLTVSEVNGNAFTPGEAIALDSGATVTMSSDGNFSYDPNGQFDSLDPGETATDSFTYTAIDSEGESDTATVSMTINGIANSLVLVGTSGVDDLMGSSGDDQIFGLGDNDTLRGNDGNDLISGGSGDDTIFGNKGVDDLSGGSGNDFLAGGEGNDIANGGVGNDHLLGNTGNDMLLGYLGNDFLAGGLGDDTLMGGAGDDELKGNIGDDVLDGGLGNDQLFGGDGADQIILRAGDGLDFTFGFEDGVDTFLLVGGLTFAQLQLTASGTGVMIQDLTSGEQLMNVMNASIAELGTEDFVVA
ncbi:MAG: hypothetical protein F6K16_33195, partial [Symploca sp. SIO2B6]|nr:hypothetical protein [Symploca sp. SIO2B6]